MRMEVKHARDLDWQVMLTGATRLTSLLISSTPTNIPKILPAIDHVPMLKRPTVEVDVDVETLSRVGRFHLGQIEYKLHQQGGCIVFNEITVPDFLLAS